MILEEDELENVFAWFYSWLPNIVRKDFLDSRKKGRMRERGALFIGKRTTIVPAIMPEEGIESITNLVIDNWSCSFPAAQNHLKNPTVVITALHCPNRSLFDIVCKHPFTPQGASATKHLPKMFQLEDTINVFKVFDSKTTFPFRQADFGPSNTCSSAAP